MTTPLPILESLLDEFPGLAYRCLHDDAWTMQYVSAGAAVLTGYAPQEFIGNSGISYASIIHVDDRQRVQHTIDRALQNGSGFMAEYRIVTADRQIRFVCEHGNAIRDEDGRIQALQGFVTDVTSARQMRQALDDVTARFRWIAQATNDNIWDWNLLTDELWHGPDMGNVFALPSDETRPEIACWTDLIHPDDEAWVVASIREAIRGSGREWSAEYRLRRKDGSYADVLDRAFIVRDAHGVAVRMVGGVSDLSESKRSKQHLEQLNRAVRILSQCNQRLVQAAGEAALVGDICEVIVETGAYQAVIVSLVDPLGGAGLQLASGYCPRLKRIGFDEANLGTHRHDLAMASMALAKGGELVCNDLAKDGIPPGPRDELIARGHRSAIWLPLKHGQEELGVLSIYAGAFAPFDAEEIQLLQTLANNIAFGIANLRSREERQLADARIREQASLLDKAKDAIVVHDAANHVTFWNMGAEKLYGLPADSVLGKPVDAILYGDAAYTSAVFASLAARGQWQGEVTRLRADGTEMTVEISSTLMRDGAGEAGSVMSIVTDVTRRKAAEHAVARMAFYDELTGLPNRHLLEKELHALLDRGAAGGAQGALLWIDLDHLKRLNDTRGHDVGDALLRHTSRAILDVIGDGNIAARFGGDEFVVLITELEGNPQTAVRIANRLLASLNTPRDFDGYVHSGSASVGLTYFRCGEDAAAEILKRADIAMYEAKAGGRNTLRLFDRQMQKSVDLRAELETDLRLALRDNTLHLAYQPQIAHTGEVTGVEALLRWTHPVRGPVSPAEFIPVAETSGLILACGAWVLNEACMQLKRWEDDASARRLTIAVNVSAKEILHPGFVDQVKEVLRRTGADPRLLKLELTETSLVTDADATVEKMKLLKSLGVSFALDDFGTGFSSLSYLKRLPLDQLKIDRSFVLDVVKNTNAAVITRSIIALGQSLGLEVIAEGVETSAQHRFLSMHGCKVYQGYLFSRPITVRELERFLRPAGQASPALLIA